MRLAAPSATLWLDASQNRIVGLPDRYALGRLYWGRSDSLSVISSASWIVARLLNRDVDTRSIGMLALIGHGVGSATMFEGVHRVPAGHFIEAADGLVQMELFTNNVLAPSHSFAKTFRDLVRARAEAYPEAPIEISGGLDSRLILAALDSHDLSRRRGYTIGFSDMPDVVVAKKLAVTVGMAHDVHEPPSMDRLGQPEFSSLLHELARTSDFSSNVVDRTLFEVIERDRPVSARFNGQNGELLRGFYYPWQPVNRVANSGPVSRLVRWRLVFNDQAEQSLFDKDWLRASLSDYTGHIRDVLAVAPGRAWGNRLDYLYLTERMARWCGDALGNLPIRRSAIMPFFDHRVVEYALNVSPSMKNGRRFQAALINELSPDLGSVPLDTGRTPEEIATSPALDVSGYALFAKKTAVKITSKFRKRLPNTIIRSALDRFYDFDPCDILPSLAGYRFGFLNPRMLDDFFSGKWQPDRATLSFLINLDALARELVDRRSMRPEIGAVDLPRVAEYQS
jgi:asparagine synthase (glutamine-hydrolysing)